MSFHADRQLLMQWHCLLMIVRGMRGPYPTKSPANTLDYATAQQRTEEDHYIPHKLFFGCNPADMRC